VPVSVWISVVGIRSTLLFIENRMVTLPARISHVGWLVTTWKFSEQDSRHVYETVIRAPARRTTPAPRTGSR
jgi:hypothetical protein